MNIRHDLELFPLKNALASAKLEGMKTPSPQALEIMVKMARKEITVDEAIAKLRVL